MVSSERGNGDRRQRDCGLRDGKWSCKARAQRVLISCSAYIAVMHKLDCLADGAMQWCKPHKTKPVCLLACSLACELRPNPIRFNLLPLSSRHRRAPP
uniref:Uncharacterized protein n=1 Tax=Vespula pensylvanica TaxID=30213 RepID=A0A834KZ90_VESPE|nr:hypothetical protein H0235_012727 [Vespula pensylvanica]